MCGSEIQVERKGAVESVRGASCPVWCHGLEMWKCEGIYRCVHVGISGGTERGGGEVVVVVGGGVDAVLQSGGSPDRLCCA